MHEQHFRVCDEERTVAPATSSYQCGFSLVIAIPMIQTAIKDASKNRCRDRNFMIQGTRNTILAGMESPVKLVLERSLPGPHNQPAGNQEEMHSPLWIAVLREIRARYHERMTPTIYTQTRNACDAASSCKKAVKSLVAVVAPALLATGACAGSAKAPATPNPTNR